MPIEPKPIFRADNRPRSPKAPSCIHCWWFHLQKYFPCPEYPSTGATVAQCIRDIQNFPIEFSVENFAKFKMNTFSFLNENHVPFRRLNLICDKYVLGYPARHTRHTRRTTPTLSTVRRCCVEYVASHIRELQMHATESNSCTQCLV